MKNRILTTLTLFLLPLATLFAQVPPPPDTGEDAGGPGAPSTPIDQYLLILMLIGIVLFAYATISRRKLAKN